jgi:pilus assembly protein CpaB
MKVAVICLVIFGLIAAVCAAVLVTTLSRPSGPVMVKAGSADPDVDVLVAAHELAPMSVVDSKAVVTRKVPKSQVPQNALLNPVQVVGKVLTDRMLPDQPFTKAVFAREGTGVYLATALPPGKRAMSISLTDWSGMAGLLYPGSVVDVLVSFKTLGVQGRTDNTEMLSTTLLQNLQVLAIGSQSIADDEYKDKQAGALAQRGQINTRMVTLLVDPKQAEVLQLATQAGSIALAMRNPLDASQEMRRLTRAREISPTSASPGVVTAIDDADPFAEKPEPTRTAAKPAAPPPPNEWQTTVIRGNESRTRTFSLPPAASGEPTAREEASPADAAAAPKVNAAPAEPAVSVEPIGAGAGAGG